MTDKQIICAEIKKLRKEYDIDTTPIAKYQIAQAILNRLSDVIDSLPEEPASEVLEEAADEYSLNNQEGLCTHSMKCAAFKAGAEWQKQSIITKAIEWLQRNIDSSMWLMNFRKYLED